MSEPVDFDSYLNEQLGDEPVQEETPVADTQAIEQAEDEGMPVARDEAGRFKAAEETPAEDVAEEEAPAAEELILGKYKSNEEAIKALEHSQREIGRLGQELGELRQQISQPPQQEYDLSGIDEISDPSLAAAYTVAAMQQGDELAFQRSLRVWAELDPVGANDFNTRKLLGDHQRALTSQLGPQLAASQEVVRQRIGETALDAISSQHPDFADVITGISSDEISGLTESSPMVQLALENFKARNDEASAVAFYDTLYNVRKAQQAGQRQTVQTEHNQETQLAKTQAQVASASTTAVDTGDESPRLLIEGFDGTLDEFHKEMLASSPTSWYPRGGQ